MEILKLKYPLATEDWNVKSDPCVMALGFFDGVHRGHRKIIESARRVAKSKNLTFSVMTFFPHPSQIIPGVQKIENYLTPLPLKTEIFEELGVEKLIIVDFNMEFSRLSPQQFVKLFIKALQCKHVVAGFDFKFGFKGQGTMEWLTLNTEDKFEVTTVSKLSENNEKISSTIIRELLAAGKVQHIPRHLGRSYEVHGQIESKAVENNKNNRLTKVKIKDNYFLPRKGCYLVEVCSGDISYEGIAALEGNELEVFLFNCSDILDNNIKVTWISKHFDGYLEFMKQNQSVEFSSVEKEYNNIVI